MTNEQLLCFVNAHPYPLVFATVSGAHLYGFPSADSDYDLRGMHVLPARMVLGLSKGRETIILEETVRGTEIDIVSQEAEKFFRLLLKRNGYVLEQLYSPLVVHTSDEHEELKEIAKGCVTRHHVHHYLGFAHHELELFQKNEPRLKPLLYVFRVLLTGIHLMKTGVIEANLATLAQVYGHTYLRDLIEEKRNGQEKQAVQGADVPFFRARAADLIEELKAAADKSGLPDKPTAESALNDLLIRLRLATL